MRIVENEIAQGAKHRKVVVNFLVLVADTRFGKRTAFLRVENNEELQQKKPRGLIIVKAVTPDALVDP